MQLYPSDIAEKLEFDKILERLSGYCLGEPAKKTVLKMRCFNQKAKIERLLDEILEFKLCNDLQIHFPLYHYTSVNEELDLLRKVDYVLEIEAYIRIYDHLNNINEIVRFFSNQEMVEKFPLLNKIASQIDLEPSLIGHFERIFSEDGKIKPTASPELNKIFSLISSKERELDSVFSTLIEKYKKQGYLTENLESYKNSRRVLSVSAESKRKIKGIIHDESATGKTVFIEPEAIVELNNALFELEASKRHEVYKILKNLSGQLRPYVEDFELWQKILIRYDLIRAKAAFASSYGGVRPGINEESGFEVFDLYHPLLKLLNDEAGKATIPLNLKLDEENRILVISGPNAGGKSISLKAIGLNQMMLQSGLLIPSAERSRFMIFNKIMIDIGDQQSIEGDLSTYSSRLLHMKHFVDKSGKRSLLLMDEFGSGSDPKMGGAIAEAVLDRLVKTEAFGIITTHYSNIKNYAYRSESILNGAMLFDKNELKPTYTLKVGQPGSSFAFEIAEKIGLPKQLLNYAKHKAGKDSKTVDQLLIDLQHEKKELEKRLSKAKEEEIKLKRLIENYESLKDELHIRRKKLKLEARQKNIQEISDSEKELQKLIRELRKEKDIDKARQLVKKLKERKKDSVSEVKELSEDVFSIEIEKVKDLKVGDFVRLRSGGDAGKVIEFDDRKVRIEMGLMQFEVPRSEIFIANQPIERKGKSITTDTKINSVSLESKLDIRGYSRADALASIQEFLDNALMSSSTQLKVLHGKGSGVLKKALWEKAKEYKDIKKIWHPEEEFGGQGVTLISFV